MEDPAKSLSAPPSDGGALTRFGPGYAALIGLIALAILLQAIFAGVFIEPGTHSGSLDAHKVNAVVTAALGLIAAIYACALLRRAARSLAIGSVVLAVLLIAVDAIGHAITDSSDDGLTPVHIPLALACFGLTIWLSARARSLRRAPAG